MRVRATVTTERRAPPPVASQPADLITSVWMVNVGEVLGPLTRQESFELFLREATWWRSVPGFASTAMSALGFIRGYT
jgi:hypothetical protein